MSETENIQEFLTHLVGMMGRRFTEEYASPNEYILKHGRSYHSAGLSTSEQDAISRLNFREYKVRECYYNSQFIAITFPEFQYVEGYATGIIPVPHAWVTLNGRVIDVTWAQQGPVLGVIPEGVEYFGVPVPVREVWASITAHHTWQPIIDDYLCRWPLLSGGSHLKQKA